MTPARVTACCLASALAGGLFWASFGNFFHGANYRAPHLAACWDIDNYIKQIEDVPDISFHRPEVVQGIHRRETVDAVNELYDRAHCEPVQSSPGMQVFKKFYSEIIPDRASQFQLEKPTSTSNSNRTTTAPVKSVDPPVAAYTTRRRRPIVVDDGALDTVPPARRSPVDCGPEGNWSAAGCRD